VRDTAEAHPSLEQGDGAGVGPRARPISTSRQPVLPLIVSRTPPSRISIQPVPSSLCLGPQSRPVISERRSPPAKPMAKMARSRKPRRSMSSVASMASSSSAKIASF
jgi:hypothetical protein